MLIRAAYVRALAGGREQGQGLVEYGLIIALVSFLAITGLLLFGDNLSNWLSGVTGSV